ncbi:hypothetical protein ACFFRR_008347 [Megaselia abdita]
MKSSLIFALLMLMIVGLSQSQGSGIQKIPKRNNPFKPKKTPSPFRRFVKKPIYRFDELEKSAEIVEQNFHQTPFDGGYQYNYETANGIKASEVNEPKVFSDGREVHVANSVSGSYSYTAPNGEFIYVTYIADENGFHPTIHKKVVPGLIPASVNIVPF